MMTKKKKKVKKPKRPQRGDYKTADEFYDALGKWMDEGKKVMEHEPEKTFDKAADKARENIQKGTEEIKKEIGEVEIKEEKKKLSPAEQLAELKRIRKNNKRKKDKKAQETAKKKKKIN